MSALDGATYEQVVGGWIGWRDGQRTMLKSSREWAEIDVANGRFTCGQWPNCRHRHADECARVERRSLPRWRADD